MSKKTREWTLPVVADLIDAAQRWGLPKPGEEDDLRYAEFLIYFERLRTIERYHLIIGACFVYSWMPCQLKTIAHDKVEESVRLLNRVKSGEILDADDLGTLKGCINNSMVGASKLLHCVCPMKYPIWDARVAHFLFKEPAPYSAIVDPGRYRTFQQHCMDLAENGKSKAVTEIFRNRGYQITDMRAIELVMYGAGKKMAAEDTKIARLASGQAQP